MASEFISYDVATGKISNVAQPIGGTWGQASFGRLCEILEAAGEILPDEKVVALVIQDGFVRFQVKAR